MLNEYVRIKKETSSASEPVLTILRLFLASPEKYTVILCVLVSSYLEKILDETNIMKS